MTTIKKAISLANSGKSIPAMELVRRNPAMAALLSKLHEPEHKAGYGPNGNREHMQPDIGRLRSVATKTAQSITDSETVLTTLPDTELSIQILVSSIISPSDMTSTELNYTGPEGLVSPHITAALTEQISQHFDQVYNIKSQLSSMLRDMLAITGSYAVAVIPENSIDEVINGNSRIGMESLSQSISKDGSVRNIGLLGPARNATPKLERAPGIALESFDTAVARTDLKHNITLEGWLDDKPLETYLTVVDNPDVLKIPQINLKLREERIRNAVGAGVALESISNKSKLNDRELTALLFKQPHFSFQPVTTLKTQEQLSRKTVGNPLVLHLSSESVLPAYVPGNVKEHIGYFVLLDGEGNPIVRPDRSDYYQQLQDRLSSNDSFASTMLNKVRNQSEGFSWNNTAHMDMTTRMYGEAIEADLLARLRNGVYGNGVALAKNEEVYRIMLSRALQKKHTQILFLPVELMTYFAFRYNSDGIGKSLLEEMKILNSLRAMLQFANVMAGVRNSIARTEVKIKLDEDDPDPDKTIETVMHEIQKTRHPAYPVGVTNPVDMVDWMGKAGFEFVHEGHPGLPDVKVDFGEKSSNYVKVDTELEEDLRRRSTMGFGLSPETVDSGFSPEFATTVVSNNLLLAKRVMQYQEQFCEPLSEHHRKIIMNSEGLVNALRLTLEQNYAELRSPFKDEVEKKLAEPSNDQKFSPEQIKSYVVSQLLEQFVRGLKVSLPSPNMVSLASQKEALESYIEALEMGLDAYISADFLTGDFTSEEVSKEVDAVKAMLRAHFIRQWMANNGMLTELSAITTTDDDGKPALNIYDMQQDHLKNLGRSIAKLTIKMQTLREGFGEAIQSVTGEEGLDGGGGGDSSGGDSSGDDNGDGSGDDGSGGGDEFSFDLGEEPAPADATPEQAPLEEEPEAEPEPKEEPPAS